MSIHSMKRKLQSTRILGFQAGKLKNFTQAYYESKFEIFEDIDNVLLRGKTFTEVSTAKIADFKNIHFF